MTKRQAIRQLSGYQTSDQYKSVLVSHEIEENFRRCLERGPYKAQLFKSFERASCRLWHRKWCVVSGTSANALHHRHKLKQENSNHWSYILLRLPIFSLLFTLRHWLGRHRAAVLLGSRPLGTTDDIKSNQIKLYLLLRGGGGGGGGTKSREYGLTEVPANLFFGTAEYTEDTQLIHCT